MNKAFFLDRDGVINVEKNYVYQKHDFEFHQGVFEACRMINAKGYKIIIVTNQSGIGRGYYTETQFLELSQWMLQKFKEQQICISDVYFCPHHITAGIGAYKVDCDNRKPKPGMILKGAKEHHIDLKCSVLVGDRITDMVAGKNAGIDKLFHVSPTVDEHSEVPFQYSISLLNAVTTYFQDTGS
ncbi:HAD family hydrolase [Paraglaciecola polaris]|uniref:D-glycero-alpha-D-manno-heptose-1,7-bisphosphate 7-phosphatase n=1 Tax=Paraglaciecola polaris TaxID=222814 RepID=UPI0030EC6BF3|tara:strand:- start:25130 stop:25681 length:552 start_codon:yes stop_codon:yes gene_type:complete